MTFTFSYTKSTHTHTIPKELSWEVMMNGFLNTNAFYVTSYSIETRRVKLGFLHVASPSLNRSPARLRNGLWCNEIAAVSSSGSCMVELDVLIFLS